MASKVHILLGVARGEAQSSGNKRSDRHLWKSFSLAALNPSVTVSFAPKSEHGRLAENRIRLEPLTIGT